MVRYSISLLWVSAPVEVRKGRKRATRVEREQRDDVLREEADSDTNSGDRVRENERRGFRECHSRGRKGNYCIVSKTVTRWQQRAAIPSQREGNFVGHPFRKGCSRPVVRYGDIYGTNQEFP